MFQRLSPFLGEDTAGRAADIRSATMLCRERFPPAGRRFRRNTVGNNITLLFVFFKEMLDFWAKEWYIIQMLFIHPKGFSMRFASRIVSLLLSLLLAALFAACDGSSEQSGKIGRLDVIYGADQCTIPGEEFERDIRVEIRGVADGESASTKKLPVLAG